MKIISVYPNFKNKGGAQNVCLQLATQLNDGERVVLINTPLNNIPKEYTQQSIYFETFSIQTVLKYNHSDTIFLSHHRKTTLILMLIKFFLKNKLHIVHVAHNVFFDWKHISIYPQWNISVSEAVKHNLMQCYNIPQQRIKRIYNGLFDRVKRSTAQGKQIKILYAGRLTTIKQQVEFVKQIKSTLPANICIDFAGEGEDKEILLSLIKNNAQLRYIGLVDIYDILPEYDYVCLFSKKEGLGLSLIEGCMFAKPLITNALPAVLEVNHNGYNGFVFPTWEELKKGLQQLPHRDTNIYQQMSKNSRKHYEENFTERKMIEQYREFLSNII